MRRVVMLAALALSFVAPSTVAAGGCPTDPGGLVDKDTYRIGELLQFLDSYADFGDPGTTTFHFERSGDGKVLDYTATNEGDGTWYLELLLDSNSFVGRWNVTATVDQTSGINTCTDTVTILPLNAPVTDTFATPPTAPGFEPLAVAALLGAAFFLRQVLVPTRR